MVSIFFKVANSKPARILRHRMLFSRRVLRTQPVHCSSVVLACVPVSLHPLTCLPLQCHCSLSAKSRAARPAAPFLHESSLLLLSQRENLSSTPPSVRGKSYHGDDLGLRDDHEIRVHAAPVDRLWEWRDFCCERVNHGFPMLWNSRYKLHMCGCFKQWELLNWTDINGFRDAWIINSVDFFFIKK